MQLAVYHKIGDYYGVMIDGCTVFSGSKEACEDYVTLFTDDEQNNEPTSLPQRYRPYDERS